MEPQDEMGPEEDNCAPPNMEDYSQDGILEQQSEAADDYGNGENGYKMEATGEEY